jgi:hypothetical protein
MHSAERMPYGSTKSQAPAFAEGASRRQAKFQINPNYLNLKQNLSGYLKLEFGVGNGFKPFPTGICLPAGRQGICHLGF